MSQSPKRSRLPSNSDYTQNSIIPFEAIEYEEAYSGLLRRYQFTVQTEVGDLLYFIREFTKVLNSLLSSLSLQMSGFKYQAVITANYRSLRDETKPPFPMHLRTAYYRYFRGESVSSSIESANQELMARNDHVLKFESGVRLERIFYATIFVHRFEP